MATTAIHGDPPKKVWIVRWCLAEGILVGESDGQCLAFTLLNGAKRKVRIDYYTRPGRDFFETEYAAVDAAREMRNRRVASLKKQIKKLEAMRFDVKE